MALDEDGKCRRKRPANHPSNAAPNALEMGYDVAALQAWMIGNLVGKVTMLMFDRRALCSAFW